jgi:hypothetical protein
MTRLISAEVGDEVLASSTEYSDRFVYSNYFVPLSVDLTADSVPMIPFYTKQQILQFAVNGVWSVDRLKSMLEELDLKGLWEQNDFDEALANSCLGVPSPRRRSGRAVRWWVRRGAGSRLRAGVRTAPGSG